MKMFKKVIALDDGHGMETPGKRTPTLPDGLTGETGARFMHENEFNRRVVYLTEQNLLRCGFDVVQLAPGDKDVPLQDRSQAAIAAGVDLVISVHANALTGKFGPQQGVSTHYYPTDQTSKAYATLIQNYLIMGTIQRNRGIVASDFHMLRVPFRAGIPSILVECAFMDNEREAKLLLSESFRQEVADELAQAVCIIFGIGYVAAAGSENLTFKESVELIAKYTGTDPGYWSNRPHIDKYFAAYINKIARAIKNKII